MRASARNLAILTAIMFIAVRGFAQTIADSPDNRAAQADRYLAAMPAEEQQKYMQPLLANLDIDALTKDMKDAMVKHFTAEELKALADFYSSPVGKSAMSKFGGYMSDLMPVMQAEIMKAQAKASQSSPAP